MLFLEQELIAEKSIVCFIDELNEIFGEEIKTGDLYLLRDF